MEGKNYTPIKLEGEAYYKNITNISFTPVEKRITLNPKVRKGKLYFWRLWGFIPLIPLVAKKDLYRASNNPFYRFSDLQEAYDINFPWGNTFLKGNDVYDKAKVRVNCVECRLNNTQYFKDNESAMQHLEALKAKCKEVGNILK